MARRCALLIGCDTYDHDSYQKLAAPVADVADLAVLLRDDEVGHYDTVAIIGEPGEAANHDMVRQAIEAFFLHREPDDMLLLYIGCHGVRAADGELLFVMRDTRPDLLRATAISSVWVSRCLEDSRSKRIVVLLDCCYSGAYRARGDTGSPILHVAEGDTGRMVITASRATERAWEQTDARDGRPPRSFFMDAVVSGIDSGDADRDGDGRISVLDLYEYVRAQMEPVRALQRPVLQGVISGSLDVAWRRGPRPVEAPAGAGPPRLVPQPIPAPRDPRLDQVRVVPVMLPRPRGDSRTFVVQRWLHQPGDRVEQGSVLLEVAGGGALSYVESPATGILRVISAVEGETVDPSATLGAIVIGGYSQLPRQRIAPVTQRRSLRTAVVTLPTLGRAGLATVITWWCAVGDRVAQGQPLLQIAMGSVVHDITSPVSGVVRAIAIEEREAAGEGEIVAIVAIE